MQPAYVHVSPLPCDQVKAKDADTDKALISCDFTTYGSLDKMKHNNFDELISAIRKIQHFDELISAIRTIQQICRLFSHDDSG